MKFMRLVIQEPMHAFFNMALDEAVSEAVRGHVSPPTLRLYRWERPSLSIGYFQKISDIDSGYCIKKGYPVVRRLTGGRAILHDAELTYSLSAVSDSPPFTHSLLENYEIISSALISGLKQNSINAEMSLRKKHATETGNPACFKAVSYGEITVNGKKIIGSAQKRFHDGFMQHGSILFDFDPDELGRILKCGDKADFRCVGSVHELNRRISVSRLIRSLREAFEKRLGMKIITDGPTNSELEHADYLVKHKYSTEEWNFRR